MDFVDFEIFDEDGQRVLEIYSGATAEDIEMLNNWIGELGATCTDYVAYITSKDDENVEGWEDVDEMLDEMLTHMAECAGKIADILGCGVTNPADDHLEWWVDGCDKPLVWCEMHSSYGDCYWTEARLAGSADKPPEWSWSHSNGSATDEQTTIAYDAITGNGLLSDFSHEVWNDMVNKVLAILDYADSSWTEYDSNGNTYLSYEDTLMSDDDTQLTAERFNALRFNIGSRYSTGINPVDTGDEVYGWYFTQLTEKINEWIASI